MSCRTVAWSNQEAAPDWGRATPDGTAGSLILRGGAQGPMLNRLLVKSTGNPWVFRCVKGPKYRGFLSFFCLQASLGLNSLQERVLSHAPVSGTRFSILTGGFCSGIGSAFWWEYTAVQSRLPWLPWQFRMAFILFYPFQLLRICDTGLARSTT